MIYVKFCFFIAQRRREFHVLSWTEIFTSLKKIKEENVDQMQSADIRDIRYQEYSKA